jgi:penicillin-binding protein-related factor A (putative recombinase)
MLVITTAKIEAVFQAVPEIKDRIIDKLTCINAIIVTKAFPILLTTREKIKYTNVVKNIIIDKKWLRNMVKEGYTFTVVGRDLDKVKCIDANTKIRAVLLLFVTRDNSFILPTNDFVSAEKFMFSYKGCPIETCNPNYVTVPSTFTLPSLYRVRTVNAARQDTTISIVMLIVAASTNTPVEIS